MRGQKVNILHMIETSEPGGAETVLANIANHLDKKRFRSLVCVLEEGWLTKYLKKLDLPYIIIENKRSYDPLFLWRIIRLIGREQIDILHAHEFMMTVYGSLAGRIRSVPMIGTIHGKLYYPDKARRVRMLKMAVSLCSRMIAVSEELRRFLTELFGSESDKLTTLYNGIDLEKYSSGESKAISREALSIPIDVPIVGTVSSLFRVKGLSFLLESVTQLATRYPGFLLLITGVGDQEEILKSQAESLGISESVRFLGFRDDVPRILNAMDVYVCSSLSEGHSLSILEAMACSKPIVATNVGGNPELIVNDQNGLLVDSGEPSALTTAISKLLDEPTLREAFGAASRSIVEERFSLETMISNYQKLYEGLLS